MNPETRAELPSNRAPNPVPDPGSGPGSTPVTHQPAIQLAGIRKAFRGHLSIGTKQVLHGLSLSVEPGKIHGLLGPNGAGKTTTIRLVLGLIRPDAGHVEIFGRPVPDPESRRSVGFLPENPYFYDYLTGREFLDLSARLIGLSPSSRKSEIDRLLAAVGMQDRADTPLRRCSKGMVQRIGMAQALIGDPELVILDEPMSGLDPIGRREFRDLILDERRRGKSVFFSSHILQDAEMICDRVSILDQGLLVAEGDLGALLGRDVRFWEVTVYGCDPARLGSEWTRLATAGNELIVRATSEEDLDRLLEAARREGGRIRAVVPCRDTLEDLFLKQIGAASHAGQASRERSR